MSSLYTIFFLNGTATTEIYTLSLHDALPIYRLGAGPRVEERQGFDRQAGGAGPVDVPVPLFVVGQDRKSTRLNSSHQIISYAVFCLKKKNHKDRSKYRTEEIQRGLHHSIRG